MSNTQQFEQAGTMLSPFTDVKKLPSSTIVFQNDGQAQTTSIIVARVFKKDHKNVVRSIKELQTSAQNCANLFEESTYKDSYGRDQVMYLMNRDGFTLLAMGFTGEKALEFKMKFPQAFSAMEKMLTSDDYILLRSQQILQQRNQLLQQQIQILEGENQHLQLENKTLAPKAQYTDEVLQSTSTITFTEAAKELNFRSVGAFTQRLLQDRIVFRQGGRYLPYAKYSGLGLFVSRTHKFYHNDGRPDTSVMTVITEKGRMFLHNHFGIGVEPVDFTNVRIGGAL